ncbi:ATP-dependent nuclease [Caulobacter segnis]|uniref:ATP-dependent nuclease n=1 Tax=Caulobacter segnis TaxID=88688 RepID=UPI001CBAF7F1|nr:AAA family ATPase [Caulobacter segnis]UAL10810.1 AAA family ATPase [Caulobacter segnis]
MATNFSDLIFNPTIDGIVPPGTTGSINILTGMNNSGKSAYLKQTIDNKDKLYIGVNRFYSFHHLQFYNGNNNELDDFYNSMFHTKRQPFQNFEGAFFNAATALTRLTNHRRKALFKTFKELFGHEIEVKAEDPNNEFSNRYVSVDGDSLSVTSSGTRLFLGILAAIMDERFSTIAIDEPELGLSPILQRRLSEVIMGPRYSSNLFPHNPNIIISTHSHLFLDKINPSNNWIVSRENNNISARRCIDFSELHDIQLRLLGNDLGDLFLPHAVIFVEGETDKMYLEKVIRILFPKTRAVVQDCGGDIAQRLNYWAQSIGDIQTSPYRERTFAIYDKVEQAGLDRICNRLGLPDNNKIKWSGNGIEYMYPESSIREVFKTTSINSSSITIDGDYVRCGTISYKKMELCRMICDTIDKSTIYPKEFEEKFLSTFLNIAAISA